MKGIEAIRIPVITARQVVEIIFAQDETIGQTAVFVGCGNFVGEAAAGMVRCKKATPKEGVFLIYLIRQAEGLIYNNKMAVLSAAPDGSRARCPLIGSTPFFLHVPTSRQAEKNYRKHAKAERPFSFPAIALSIVFCYKAGEEEIKLPVPIERQKATPAVRRDENICLRGLKNLCVTAAESVRFTKIGLEGYALNGVNLRF